MKCYTDEWLLLEWKAGKLGGWGGCYLSRRGPFSTTKTCLLITIEMLAIVDVQADPFHSFIYWSTQPVLGKCLPQSRHYAKRQHHCRNARLTSAPVALCVHTTFICTYPPPHANLPRHKLPTASGHIPCIFLVCIAHKRIR